MQQHGLANTEALIRGLAHPEQTRASSCAAQLRGTSDGSAIDALIYHATHPSDYRQYCCISALRGIQDDRVLPILVDGLLSDNVYVRCHSAAALVGTTNPTAIEALKRGLLIADANYHKPYGYVEIAVYPNDIQRACAVALVQSRDPEALTTVIDGLSNESWMIRYSCAHALGGVTDERAIAALKRGQTDSHSWVASECKRVLNGGRPYEGVVDTY